MPTITPRDLLAALNPIASVRRLTLYWWLAEWKHTLEFGRPITDQPFYANDLYEAERIVQEFLTERRGRLVQRVLRYHARRRLPATALAAIDHVRNTCDADTLSEVDRLVRSTHPHLTLERGTPIDLPQQALEYRQRQSERAHAAQQLTASDMADPDAGTLEVSLEEGLRMLGARGMILEYVPGLPNPWRVRYHAATREQRDAPTRYTLHAHGPDWPTALTAALGVTITERQPSGERAPA